MESTSPLQQDKSKLEWSQIPKHTSSDMTEVDYPLSVFILDKAKFNMTDTEKNGKRIINVSYGEPTRANGYEIPQVLNDAVIEVVQSGTKNGYSTPQGSIEARQAIVDKFTKAPNNIFTANDVFFAFGGHGCLQVSITALCNRGENILIPRPGFPLVQPICQSLGVEIRYYDLLPEKSWEVDLNSIRRLTDEKTKAIMIINPSNPCSVVYSKEHQLEILALANELKVPLLCDEIYSGITYPGHDYQSFAELTTDVPLICLGSLSKMFIVPGWRVGWMIVYNRHGYFDIVKDHLYRYLRIPFHPSTLAMQALPKIFKEVPDTWYEDYRIKLAESAYYLYDKLKDLRGITPIKPNAAMYMMVKIEFDQFRDDANFKTDEDFVLRFWDEESVLFVPSHIFFLEGFFRVVTCISKENSDEIAVRLERFTSKYLKPIEQ